jgi:hypothetical protein
MLQSDERRARAVCSKTNENADEATEKTKVVTVHFEDSVDDDWKPLNNLQWLLSNQALKRSRLK